MKSPNQDAVTGPILMFPRVIKCHFERFPSDKTNEYYNVFICFKHFALSFTVLAILQFAERSEEQI